MGNGRTAGFIPGEREEGTIERYKGKYVMIYTRNSSVSFDGCVRGVTPDGFVILDPYVGTVWTEREGGLKKLLSDENGIAVRASEIVDITPSKKEEVEAFLVYVNEQRRKEQEENGKKG